MKDFTEYCKDFIKDNIYYFISTDNYGGDFGFNLTNDINMTGSVTCNRKDSIDLIHDWWDDCKNFSDFEYDNYGVRTNPFDEPEVFVVRMVIEGVNYLLSETSVIKEHWDDNFTLSDTDVSKILDDINNIYEIKF